MDQTEAINKNQLDNTVNQACQMIDVRVTNINRYKNYRRKIFKQFSKMYQKQIAEGVTEKTLNRGPYLSGYFYIKEVNEVWVAYIHHKKEKWLSLQEGQKVRYMSLFFVDHNCLPFFFFSYFIAFLFLYWGKCACNCIIAR